MTTTNDRDAASAARMSSEPVESRATPEAGRGPDGNAGLPTGSDAAQIPEDETPGAFGPGYVYNPAVFGRPEPPKYDPGTDEHRAGRPSPPVPEGNVECWNCGAVIAWEGDRPTDCLKCGEAL